MWWARGDAGVCVAGFWLDEYGCLAECRILMLVNCRGDRCGGGAGRVWWRSARHAVGLMELARVVRPLLIC